MPLLGSKPDIHTLHILDSILNHLGYESLLNFIDAFPAHLRNVYAWGLGPTGLWMDGMFQCTHHQEVIDWHTKRQGVDSLTLPLDSALRQMNLADSEFPITYWVHTDRLDLLRRLHTDGCWEPLGWTLHGYSYFKMAFDHNAPNVLAYIAEQVENNATFCTSTATIPDITGIPQIMRVTHLDIALEAGFVDKFWSWWTSIQPQPNATVLLNRTSRRLLCETASYQQAQDLFSKHNIDISSSVRPIGNVPPMGYTFPDGRGTPWHLAVRNPNVDFIDFLLRHIPAQVDLLQGETRSPLVEALEEGKHEHFDRLLSRTADPGVATTRVLSGIPHWNDKWFISLKPWIRYNLVSPGSGGSALHVIVEGLNAELERIDQSEEEGLTSRKKGNLKRQKINRAERLIGYVRQGNVHGQPDLGLKDGQGRTAHEHAEEYELHWIYSALNPRPRRSR